MNRISRLINSAYGKPSLIRSSAVWIFGMGTGDILMQTLSKKDVSDRERTRRMVSTGFAMGAVESIFCRISDNLLKPYPMQVRFGADLTVGTILVVTTFFITYNVQLKEKDFWEMFARDWKICGYQTYMFEICMLPLMKLVYYESMPRNAQVYIALMLSFIYGVYLSYHKHCNDPRYFV